MNQLQPIISANQPTNSRLLLEHFSVLNIAVNTARLILTADFMDKGTLGIYSINSKIIFRSDKL